MSMSGYEQAERRRVRRLIGCDFGVGAGAKAIRREISNEVISREIQFAFSRANSAQRPSEAPPTGYTVQAVRSAALAK